MKKICLFLLLALPASMLAQQSNLGNWWIYFGNKKLNDSWNIHHEVQYRNYNLAGDLEQLLLRAGVGYNLSENNNNILLGYGYIISENYLPFTEEKLQVNEHRIYQQFITKQKFGRWNIQHRYRLEERFVEDDFKIRFRYFLAGTYALGQLESEKNNWYLSAYNELFIGSTAPSFDRNRLYGGLGLSIHSNLQFELGYMNQYFQNNGRDQLNVIAKFQF